MSKTDLSLARILSFFIGGRIAPSSLDGNSDGDLNANHVGKETNQEVWDWYNSPEGQAWKNRVTTVLPQTESVIKQLGDANATINDLHQQITDLAKRPTQSQLDALQKAANDAKANADAATAALKKIQAENAQADTATTGILRALWRKITGK